MENSSMRAKNKINNLKNETHNSNSPFSASEISKIVSFLNIVLDNNIIKHENTKYIISGQ